MFELLGDKLVFAEDIDYGVEKNVVHVSVSCFQGDMLTVWFLVPIPWEVRGCYAIVVLSILIETYEC